MLGLIVILDIDVYKRQVKRSSIPQGEGVGKIQEFGLDGRKPVSYTHLVEVAASAGTQGDLNTINLGGLAGSLVGSIVMEDYARLTGVSGALDMTGKTVTLKLADSNVRTEWNGTAGGTFANDVVLSLIHI